MTENEDKAVTEGMNNEDKGHHDSNNSVQKNASNPHNIQNGKDEKSIEKSQVSNSAGDDTALNNKKHGTDENQEDELQIISLDESDDPEEKEPDEKPTVVKTVILTPSEELTPGVKKRKTAESAQAETSKPAPPKSAPEQPARRVSDDAADEADDAASEQDDSDEKPEIKPDSPTRKVLKIETQKIPDQFDRLTPHKPDTAILSARNMLRKKIETGNLSNVANPSENREIILVIRGMVERLVLRDNKRVVLGRTDIKSRAVPDIDLTPYGALDRGVSREHATLHIEGDHLYVTDLDSTNGTYLAGKRITPYVPSILRKGDELLLGRLPVQVLFR